MITEKEMLKFWILSIHTIVMKAKTYEVTVLMNHGYGAF